MKQKLPCKMSTKQFNAKPKSVARDALGDQMSLVLECTIWPAHSQPMAFFIDEI